MIRPEDALLVGEELLEQPQGLAGVAGPFGPGGNVVPGRERILVIRPEDALPVGDELLAQPQGLAGVAGLSGPGGNVAPGRERNRVIRPEDGLDAFLPAPPALEILRRNHRLSRGKTRNRPLMPSSGPKMLCFPRRGITVKRLILIVGLHRGQLTDGLGQGCMGLFRCDPEHSGGRVEQVVGKGLVEHPDLLGIGARRPANHKATQIDQDVTHVGDPPRASQVAAGGA